MLPEPLRTRPARPDEAGAIRALVRAAYARWVPIVGREPRPMTADYQQAMRAHRFDIVDGDDGSILALIETDLRDDHFWIENIAVAPEAQGQGIGRQLLALAERLAQAAGRRELRLLTNGLMVSNIRLYQSAGYAIDRKEPYGEGTTVYMRKVLAAA
jgi:ribosomal protein S18 acetylase RimI-like enzyme